MKPSRLPSKEELIAFIRERSGKVSAREIARAFGAKNMDRAAINRMLRELTDAGEIDRQRKRLHHAGTMPPVVLADVTGRDSDGELLAKPTEWDEAANGQPPVIHINTPRRARPGEVAGVGDRALIRIEQSRDGETSGRVIKLLDRAKHRALGIFRSLPSGGGRLVPIALLAWIKPQRTFRDVFRDIRASGRGQYIRRFSCGGGAASPYNIPAIARPKRALLSSARCRSSSRL